MENTEKVYTQEEVDNIIKKAKENQQSQFERKYISKEEYGLLENKYNDLVKTIKSDSIKVAFKNLGGLESSFDDMLALNPNLLNLEDNQQLNSELSKIKEHKPYFFDNVYSQFQNQVSNMNQTIFNDKDVMLEMIDKQPNQPFSNTIVGLDSDDEKDANFS